MNIFKFSSINLLTFHLPLFSRPYTHTRQYYLFSYSFVCVCAIFNPPCISVILCQSVTRFRGAG
jgi:hypothetical protein